MSNIKRWGGLAALCLALPFFAACELPKGDSASELTSAIRNNDVPRVRQLLAEGVSPNDSAEGGAWTHLMVAVMQDNAEIVGLLLDHGADMYARTRNLQTPLHLAARWGKTSATEILLRHRASPEMLDELGWTPLMWAAMRNKLEPAEKLLKAGAMLKTVDSDGNTPLILSAWRGHRDMTKLLLSHGADPRAKNRNGLTAAGVAARNGFPDLAAEIRAYAAKKSR